MKPYIPIKVYRWYNKDKYELYIFDKSSEIYKEGKKINENIYIDDNIDDGLNKIALYIRNYENETKKNNLYYAWNGEKSLSHKINKIKWKGYNVNPFLSSNRGSEELKEDITYTFNTNELFDMRKVNIVYNEDISEDLKRNKYYFIEKKIGTYKSYKLRDDKLYDLVLQDTEYIKKYNDRYNRVDLYGKLKKKLILSELYDNIRTKKNIALVQWINDNSKIMYKMQKKHFIKKEQLLNWCNISKITKINCINIYYIITKGCYCKITINNIGEIVYSYIFDVRKNINWEIINKTKIILTNYLKKYIREKIKMREMSLKLSTSYVIDNTLYTNFVSKISSYIDIFSVKKSQNKEKKEIICIYKRSSYYNDNIDINEYILSRYNLGISKEEIEYELVNLGYNIENAREEIINVIENIEINDKELKKTKIKDNGTIILISKSNNGFDIEITNSANYKELNYLLYWLSKIIASSRKITKKEENKKEDKKEEKKDDYKLDKEVIEKEIEEEEIDKLGELDYNLDDDDEDELLGGAIGKEKHSYFVDLIKKVDKDLVTDNYARDKCQSDFQPIVLTKEEKENLEKNKQTYYDNILEYGSSKEKLNYYICPKLWCPISKIPLDVNKEEWDCPLDNEEPMKMFWGNDKNKPRYIKLIKPNDKGLCAPCCGKKLQKEEELKKCKIPTDDNIEDNLDINKIKIKKKEENKLDKKEEKKEIVDEQEKNNYLMNQKAPIPENRQGSIPENLHSILLPEISYDMCSKMIQKTQKCYIRKGLNHRSKDNNIMIKNDSIIYAITSQLNFNNKKELINDIKNKLDIVKFLTLENGQICKDFMNIREIIPEKNEKLINKLEKDKKKLSILDYDSKNKISTSRLLNIYNAYNKFINYLSSDDYPGDKLPYYMYSLISILYKKLLIIWENDNNDIKILCPLYSSYNELLTNLDLNPEIIMLLKDNKYYEPIVFKNKLSTNNIIKLNDNITIKKIINECSNLNDNDNNTKTYKKIYSLNQWIKTKDDNYFNFEIKTILLNNDLSINYLLTESNILLNFETISISLLSNFIKDMNIKKIKFYEDIVNKDLNINRINKENYNKFKNKCKNLDIESLNGRIISENETLFNSIINISKLELKNNNIIHTNNYNEFYNYIDNENKRAYKWYNLQKYIVSVIVNKYNDDKFIKEYSKLNRLEKINKLYNKYFKSLNNNKIIKIILEELPTNNSKPITNLIKWINNIILTYKYDFMSSTIKENKDELIFSQNVFYINGIFEIPKLLLYYHDNMPNNLFDIKKNKNKDYIINNNIISDNLELPKIYEGPDEELPTKWKKKLKNKFTNLIVIKSNYNIENFKEFINWLSKYLNIYVDYNEIKEIVSNYYIKNIFDKKNINLLLNDPSFYNELLKADKTKYLATKLYIKKFNNYTNDHISNILNIVIKNNNLYPNDITFKVISDIFNISILLIHRMPNGTLQKNNIDDYYSDLVLSSTFISATKNMEERPLLIFNKILKDNYIAYYPIVEKKDTINFDSLYIKYSFVPDNIKVLINYHLKNLN